VIPKAQVLEFAGLEKLQATTVEKDYVLGWILYAIANHGSLSRWAFKGGTCLKKCFFETYRFSEDLDFTVPSNEPFDESSRGSTGRSSNWQDQGVQGQRDSVSGRERPIIHATLRDRALMLAPYRNPAMFHFLTASLMSAPTLFTTFL
jgi:predicted nucleotidyltransferase component of viral defense system